MLNAIQAVSSADMSGQIGRTAVVGQLAERAKSLQGLTRPIESLGTISAAQVTYDASGLLDTGSSRRSAIANRAISTPATAVTTDAGKKGSGIELAAALAASSIAENSALHDAALADALTKQISLNASAMTIPATTANVIVASNAATTNSLGSTSEIANSLAGNTAIDAGVQAVATVAQNPAFANLVSGNYVNAAAASAQSPLVIAKPMKIEEIKPVIAIPAISALTQLGAQSGRDGNPASGFRPRIMQTRAWSFGRDQAGARM